VNGDSEQVYDDIPIARKICAINLNPHSKISTTMLDIADAPPPLELNRKANKYYNIRSDVLAGQWGIGKNGQRLH
jgi:hypothetical protein